MVGTRTAARTETRRSVLEAADRLFHNRGFQATTVRDIAREAGVSAGTVMSVGDKEALLVKLFDGLIAERQDHADAQNYAADARCGADAVAVVDPFVALFDERRSLAQAYASILVSGRHTSVVFTDLAQKLTAVLQQVITACGCANTTEAPERAKALHAAYIGSLFIWASTPETTTRQFLTQLRDIFATICPHTGDDS